MHRRDILKRGVSLAAAGGVLGSAELTTAQPTLPAAALASGSTTEYITRPDGGHLFTRDWGTGSPIVFLAAWALPSDMWMYQMLPLCEGGRRCIAYDRRGHGRSSEGRSRLDFDVLADDLASVLETLDLHEVTLVGMSMASGEIVRYFTRHGSRRVARAIFVSPAATPFPYARPTTRAASRRRSSTTGGRRSNVTTRSGSTTTAPPSSSPTPHRTCRTG